jgi:hypothetical protein
MFAADEVDGVAGDPDGQPHTDARSRWRAGGVQVALAGCDTHRSLNGTRP